MKVGVGGGVAKGEKGREGGRVWLEREEREGRSGEMERSEQQQQEEKKRVCECTLVTRDAAFKVQKPLSYNNNNNNKQWRRLFIFMEKFTSWPRAITRASRMIRMLKRSLSHNSHQKYSDRSTQSPTLPLLFIVTLTLCETHTR